MTKHNIDPFSIGCVAGTVMIAGFVALYTTKTNARAVYEPPQVVSYDTYKLPEYHEDIPPLPPQELTNITPKKKPVLHILSSVISVPDEKITKEKAYIKQVLKKMPAGFEVFSGEKVEKSVECLARNIFNEARAEPVEGQLAVALVTANRANHDYYPDTICDVVYQKTCNLKHGVYKGCTAQFTWTWDGNPKNDHVRFKNKKGKIVHSEIEAWSRAVMIAADVVLGRVQDITEGALHYYNHNISNPKWARSKRFRPAETFEDGVIGNHRFVIDTYLVKVAQNN